MTLAVMTRTSLGHTGPALTAAPRTTAIYVLITFAAILRQFSSVVAVQEPALLLLATGAAGTAASALFTLLYFTPLTHPGSVRGRPRRSDRESDRTQPLGVLDRVNRCALLCSANPNLFRPERALQTRKPAG